MPNDKITAVGTNISEKATMIWNVADQLRGPFKPHEYGLVILPLTVVKRFHDCLLPTWQAVQDTYTKVKNLAVIDGFLTRASGYQFYNTSQFTFEKLLADPENIEATGEHLAGAHGHIVNGDVACVRQISIGQEQICHEVDNVTTGKVGSGFLPEGFGETAHQVLEDIPTVHGADLVRAEIPLGRGELLDNKVEGVAVYHALYDVVELEFAQDILHVGREAGQIITEVISDRIFGCVKDGVVTIIQMEDQDV